jgi:hypothetical protein
MVGIVLGAMTCLKAIRLRQHLGCSKLNTKIDKVGTLAEQAL